MIRVSDFEQVSWTVQNLELFSCIQSLVVQGFEYILPMKLVQLENDEKPENQRRKIGKHGF
jgi:hypothetical protein